MKNKIFLFPEKRGNLMLFFFLLVLTGAFFLGGCGKTKPDASNIGGESSGNVEPVPGLSKKTPVGNISLARSAFPWLEKGKAVDGKNLAASGKSTVHKPGEEFNRKYAEGLKEMEEEKFDSAQQIFEEIVKKFPGSEEASFAEYRLAQIFFRRKANSAALEAYKRIVANYPNSPIAENARAAIVYLETFETHEQNYVSPDVEDKKRRGF